MISDAIESIEDSLERIKIDQDSASSKMKEISDAYLCKAMERTIAHYIDELTLSLQRELGNKAPHKPERV